MRKKRWGEKKQKRNEATEQREYENQRMTEGDERQKETTMRMQWGDAKTQISGDESVDEESTSEKTKKHEHCLSYSSVVVIIQEKDEKRGKKKVTG
jgi:hypothetical protein